MSLLYLSPCHMSNHEMGMLLGWVYNRIFNAMQYFDTALQTTALVMHDSKTYF